MLTVFSERYPVKTESVELPALIGIPNTNVELPSVDGTPITVIVCAGVLQVLVPVDAKSIVEVFERIAFKACTAFEVGDWPMKIGEVVLFPLPIAIRPVVSEPPIRICPVVMLLPRLILAPAGPPI
jgi:hypothetical protein